MWKNQYIVIMIGKKKKYILISKSFSDIKKNLSLMGK